MTIKSAFVLVGISALLGGCVIKAGGFPFGAGGEGVPSPYDDSECDEVRKTPGIAKKRIEQPTTEQRALAAACDPRTWKREWGYAHQTDNTVVLVPAMDLRETHSTFEDRRVDAITGALFVIQAANNQRNDNEYVFFDTRTLAEQEADEDKGYRSEHLLGMAHLYSSMVKPVLARQLATLNIPDDAKAVLARRFDWAASKIDELIAPMKEGKKKIFVDLPMKVHADRLATFGTHAAEYAKLDVLEAEATNAKKGAGDVNAVGAKIAALRSDFLAACGGETCTYDPLYVEATRQLVFLYLGAKQPLLADAEAQVLARKDANRHGFAREIYEAQKELGVRAREAFEKKYAAKNKGLDAATTKAVVGDVPAMSFDNGFWEVPTSLPNLGSLAESKTIKTDIGTVLSVKTKGTTATIDFGTEYDSFGEPYNCVKTGRLEAIHDDGTLQWEENCQYATKKVPREKPLPITVLASEVKSLKTGEHLTFVVDSATHTAVIVDAYKEIKDEKSLTQIRGDRLDGANVGKKGASKVGTKKKNEAKKAS